VSNEQPVSQQPTHEHRGVVTAGVVGYLLGRGGAPHGAGHGAGGGASGAIGTVASGAVLGGLAIGAPVLATLAAVVIGAFLAWPILIAVAGVVVGFAWRHRGLVRAILAGAVAALGVAILGLSLGPVGAIVGVLMAAGFARRHVRYVRRSVGSTPAGGA